MQGINVGMFCYLHGLGARPELNGSLVLVDKWVGESERFGCLALDDNGEPDALRQLNILPKNLLPAGDDDEEEEAEGDKDL